MAHQGEKHSDTETPPAKDHPILSKDPSNWMKLIHTRVSIKTEEGVRHEGWVYTVDPVSESIVLVDGLNLDTSPNMSVDPSTISVQIVMGDTISEIEPVTSISSSPANAIPLVDVTEACNRLFRPAASSSSLSKEEILSRRANLKSWLAKHRIPVSVGGHDGQSLSVLSDALIIQPPFTEDSCLSTNEIILSKIQGLVKSMPKS